MRLALVVILVCGACGAVDSKKMPDAAPLPEPDACVPEDDAAFCARITDACESQSAADNCGAMRTVDCGACTGGKGCVVGVCKTPVCSGFNYTSATLTPFSRVGAQDSMVTATSSGRTIMYVQSQATCGNFATYLADEIAPGSGTYTSYVITTNLTALGLLNGQDSHALYADGLTLISRTADSKKFVTTKRSALNMTDFGAVSETDTTAINAMVATAGTLSAPVLSADGLELFYSIGGAATAVNGIYSSVRSSTTVPFPAGTKLGAPVSDYSHVTGVSSDRLALFVFFSFQGRILTRTSTNGAWVNPNAPADPPTIANWAHKPLSDCSKLVAMGSPGGCGNEDVVVMQRQ